MIWGWLHFKIKMLKTLIFSIYIITSVSGDGTISVLHHPSNLDFKGDYAIKESLLDEVYSVALGFSTEKSSNWQGMYINSPFNGAEAIVTVAVDGISDIGYDDKGHRFTLITDEDEADVYESLRRRVSERYTEDKTTLIRIDLSNGLDEIQKYDIFHEIKSDKAKKLSSSQLKISVDEDREFLQEITLLKSLIDKIAKLNDEDPSPDVFWFKVSSLHPLSDLYGYNSTQLKEAKTILNDVILGLTTTFETLYHGRVLVNVITSDASHTRRTRNVLEASETKLSDEFSDLNLAKYYSADYPVIFNIILWFGVAMVFAILAICVTIATMDPGRDSIIYRMTSTRLKKDN